MKLEEGTVKVVCSGIQDHVHLRAGIATKRSIVSARQHLKFANRIDRWPHAERVQFWIDVVNTIEQEVVGIFAGAVDAESEITAGRSGRAGRRRYRSRHEQAELVKV